jgi:hypothetical protein
MSHMGAPHFGQGGWKVTPGFSGSGFGCVIESPPVPGGSVAALSNLNHRGRGRLLVDDRALLRRSILHHILFLGRGGRLGERRGNNTQLLKSIRIQRRLRHVTCFNRALQIKAKSPGPRGPRLLCILPAFSNRREHPHCR